MPVLYVSKNLMCRSGLRRRGDPQSRPHRKSRADLKTAEALEQYKTCILYYLGVRTAHAASSRGALALLEQRAATRCAFCMQARAAVPRTPEPSAPLAGAGGSNSGADGRRAERRRTTPGSGGAKRRRERLQPRPTRPGAGRQRAAGSRRAATRRTVTSTMYFDNYVCTHYLLHGNIYLLTTSGGAAARHPHGGAVREGRNARSVAETRPPGWAYERTTGSGCTSSEQLNRAPRVSVSERRGARLESHRPPAICPPFQGGSRGVTPR